MTETVLTSDNPAGGASAQPNAAAPAAANAAQSVAPNATEGQQGQQGQSEPVKAEGAEPVQYAEFKLPENVAVDQSALEQFKGWASERKLNQEQAQGALDLHIKALKSAQEQQRQAWDHQIEKWADEIKADKEIGGAGFEANLGLAKTGLQKVATPELMALLNPFSPSNPKGLGLGNHPEIVRAFMRVGKALADDKTVPSNTPAGQNNGQLVYPNSNMK